MKAEKILYGTPVTVSEIQKEKRRREAYIKKSLAAPEVAACISFSLNIAGEIKRFPMADYAFLEGVKEIEARLPRGIKMSREVFSGAAGSWAVFKIYQDNREIASENLGEAAADSPAGSCGEISPDGTGSRGEISPNGTGSLGEISPDDTGSLSKMSSDGADSRNAAARKIKETMTAIEESHLLGRLFNIDVVDATGSALSRSSLGLSPRACLICGDSAKTCMENRSHSTELILWRTAQILNDYFRGKAADLAASCAVRALLYEVSATPKPGLVDRNNSGSHRDMDFFTFLDSSSALIPWFRDFFCIGWDYHDETDSRLFARLRFAGQAAETGMFQATKGINTHKGLVFAFAILCGALGKLYADSRMGDPEKVPDSGDLIALCRRLGACSLTDLKAPSGATAGERCYSSYGISGARGEAAAGFPGALTVGLPALRLWLSRGFSLNDAAVLALLSLLSDVDDTNMIHRGGRELAEKSKKEAKALLSEITPASFKQILSKLDAAYIEKNLSPGGCADLLAVSLMLCFLEDTGMVTPFS